MATLLLCGVFGVVAWAPAAAESLKDAMRSAYLTNPKLDAERARLRATDEEVPKAQSGFRPTVNGTATTGYRNVDSRPALVTDGPVHPSSLQVQVVQPLFRGFRVLNTVREAEATVMAAREGLRLVEAQTLLDAVTAYCDVIRDQGIVRLREDTLEFLARQAENVKKRMAGGEVTKTDVNQVLTRQAVAVSALEAARANLKLSRSVYERVIGHPPGQLKDASIAEKRLPKTLEEAKSIAEEGNPNIAAAIYREQAARHAVNKILGEFLPSVQLEATRSKELDPDAFSKRNDTTSIMGRLSMPFYQGGEVDARVRQAKQTAVSRRQEIEQSRTEVKSLVTSTWWRLQALKAQAISDAGQVDLSRQAFEGVRKEEQAGLRSVVDVLNSQQEAQNAAITLLSSRHDLVVVGFTLVGLVGQLTADYLELTENVYDPSTHYDEVYGSWGGITIKYPDGRSERMHTHKRRRAVQ